MDNNKSSSGVVMVYSKDWTHTSALKALGESICSTGVTIAAPNDIDEFVEKASVLQPIFIVLDLPPRNSVALIYTLRKQCLDTVLVLTQECFLFSDRIVGEYFSGVILKNYDSFMRAPLLLLDEVRNFSHALKENRYAVYPYENSYGISDVLVSITQLIHARFTQLIDSPRAKKIVLEWLVRGFEPKAIAQILGCSSKVVYHYRLVAMKVLGIRNRNRDFIASLVVSPGPFSTNNSFSYPVCNVPPVYTVGEVDTVSEPRLSLEHKCV